MNATGVTKGDRCNPAAAVIAKFGGVRPLARELSIDPSAITKWQRAKSGGGGLIPARYHWSLLALARRKNIALSPDDLVGKP